MTALIIFCILIGAFGTFLVVSGVLGILVGRYEVKSTPKQPMYLCPTHGPVSKTIKFVDYEGLYVEDDGTVKSRIGNWDQCIFCFNEKMTLAEKGKLNG